ncbi:hypothetical protein QZH41_005862 [Actinostola sp. cb2023]|nr:hypothetical protein QZH41_005862 [Actinostola sp. cb2023]
MNYLLTFEFDRQLKPNNTVGLPEVHGFSDGGESAYGAVIFLRWELQDGSYRCVPVLMKLFVAPLKKKSIPRLELLGCLALTRMYDTCRKALDFAKIKDCSRDFWVDSSTVLSWIKTPPRQFRPFVSARVAEVQETVGVDNFHYVRSKSNPADALTRGIGPEQLADWMEGPSFLKLPESQWPEFESDIQTANKKRLACLRGHPSTCWSDRDTNFVGAQGYLREIMHDWDVTRIQKVLVEDFSCNFKWKWNIPYASHQNGVVESLIKSVRQALNATCKNQAFTEEQWRTYLTEITYMINGRPLYPSSENIWESPPITPNDILIGQHNQPPQPDPEDKVNPRNMLRSTQNRVNEFWNCWMKYFAPNLLPRNKWFRIRENVQVGDLVLELDPNHKRSQWKMALIVGTYPGSDGLVRKVRIKTKNGGEYDRPIHKLCLITTNQELNGKLLPIQVMM